MTDTDDSQIEWVDAPPEPKRPTRKPGLWAQRLAPFRDHPGQWGKVPGGPFASNYGSLISNGKVSGAEAGEFEAVVRNLETIAGQRVGELYVRYVGPPPAGEITAARDTRALDTPLLERSES